MILPNWCENYLEVHGPSATKFMEACRGQQAMWGKECFEIHEHNEPAENEYVPFTFNALVPVPQEVLKSFHSYGYYWCLGNWGTKWDADVHSISESAVSFSTAWGPPLQWLQAVAGMYPDCVFELKYLETGMEFVGQVRYDGGICVQHREAEGENYLGLAKELGFDVEEYE